MWVAFRAKSLEFESNVPVAWLANEFKLDLVLKLASSEWVKGMLFWDEDELEDMEALWLLFMFKFDEDMKFWIEDTTDAVELATEALIRFSLDCGVLIVVCSFKLLCSFRFVGDGVDELDDEWVELLPLLLLLVLVRLFDVPIDMFKNLFNNFELDSFEFFVFAKDIANIRKKDVWDLSSLTLRYRFNSSDTVGDLINNDMDFFKN